MAHIKLDPALPGIMGLLAFRPETAKPLTELAEVLLRGPSSLSIGERETIAATVSTLNDCKFCGLSHIAIAKACLTLDGTGDDKPSKKLQVLLHIEMDVQNSGLVVTEELINKAKEFGATDQEIHDTVLIAAAFCMFNRYVDGLATFAPDNDKFYDEMGEKVAKYGYTTHESVHS